jgi:hypothetical protein
MPLASTSRVQVRYMPEATFGITPVAGNPKNLRITGESLNFDIAKTMSNEINAFRSVSSMVPTSASASGDLNGEFQYGEYDTLIQAVLNSSFVAVGTNGVSSAISATFTATTIAGTGVGTGLKAGQFFYADLTGNVAIDRILLRASKSVAPTANLITLDTSTPTVVGGPYAATVIKSSRVTNGTTQTQYSIERESSDVSEFFTFRGMTPSKLSLSLGSGSLSTSTFSFMGKDAVRNATTQLPGTPIASLAYDAMSGVSGTSCAVWEGGTPITGTFVKSVKLDYDNALRSQEALCTLGAVSIGSGTIVCKASIEVYFNSGAQFFSKFKANTNTEIVFTAFDTSGNGYVFTLPTANISSYKVNAGGKDSDMLVTIELSGLRDAGNSDATLRQVLFIDRIGAAVVP